MDLKIRRPFLYYSLALPAVAVGIAGVVEFVFRYLPTAHPSLAISLIATFLISIYVIALESRRLKLFNRERTDQRASDFTLVTEAIMHLVCIQDVLNPAKTFYNKRWQEYSGVDPAAKDFWINIIHPDDVEMVRFTYEASLAQSIPFYFQYRVKNSQGNYRWHLCRGIPIKESDGSIYRWVSTSTDIHEQKIAEAQETELRSEIENRTEVLGSILDQMPTGVMVVGPDKSLVRINSAARNYFGIDLGYEIGSMKGYFPDGKAYGIHDWPVNVVFSTGREDRREILIESKNGKKALYKSHVAPILSKSGKVIAVAVNIYDISEEKLSEAVRAENLANARAEAEIKRSQKFLEALVENIPYMIFMKDAETRKYLQVNKAVRDFAGTQGLQIIGNTSEDIYSAPQAAEIRITDDEAVRTNQMIITPRHELTIRGVGTRIFQTKKFVVDSHNGRKILIGVSHDMTDTVLVEKQNLQAKEQAEQMAKVKSEFLANMSHEIRTPLNGVIGVTELLLEGDLKPKEKEYATIVQESGRALLGIVNDILDFSKVEAGLVSLENIEFEAATFFKSHLESLKVRADAKDLALTYFFDPSLPAVVKGDPNRITQILNNLIGNAIKFTAKGSVDVRVEPVKSTKGETKIRFSVKDSGMGLTDAESARLFKPFVQGDGSMARRFGGTGLGLSISKQLVELMGGTISLESQKDLGSTFWFTVVLETVIPENKPELKLVPEPVKIPVVTDANQKHVLIAEDNTTNQILTEALLKRLGYIPHIVANGKEALDATAVFDYDLVLMDCQMPELDGYEATIQIREREKLSHKHIPIVALTANARSEDRDKCLSVGMDDFISKPIKRDFLEQVLRTWMAHK